MRNWVFLGWLANVLMLLGAACFGAGVVLLKYEAHWPWLVVAAAACFAIAVQCADLSRELEEEDND